MDHARLNTPDDLRRRRLALGVSVHDLARAVHLQPGELMDIEQGLIPFAEPELYERAFASLRRRGRVA